MGKLKSTLNVGMCVDHLIIRTTQFSLTAVGIKHEVSSILSWQKTAFKSLAVNNLIICKTKKRQRQGDNRLILYMALTLIYISKGQTTECHKTLKIKINQLLVKKM